MCGPKKETGTGSLGGTSLAARAPLFHNSTGIAARTSNAKRRKAYLGAVDMLRLLLSNGGVGFGSLPPSGVTGTRSLPLSERAMKGQGKIVHARKEDILKTHAPGPREGVAQGIDRQVAMEHVLEVPRVGKRVISDTRRDIAKDAILEPGLVSS